MVIFRSYVKVPEGKDSEKKMALDDHSWSLNDMNYELQYFYQRFHDVFNGF